MREEQDAPPSLLTLLRLGPDSITKHNRRIQDMTEGLQFYVRTDEGLELIDGRVLDATQLENESYQVVYKDWFGTERTIECYDFVRRCASKDDLVTFLDNNLDK